MAPCGGELAMALLVTFGAGARVDGSPGKKYMILRMDLDRPTSNEMHVVRIVEALRKSRMFFVRVWHSRAALGFGLASDCLATLHREEGP